jgi:hypothetical protein
VSLRLSSSPFLLFSVHRFSDKTLLLARPVLPRNHLFLTPPPILVPAVTSALFRVASCCSSLRLLTPNPHPKSLNLTRLSRLSAAAHCIHFRRDYRSFSCRFTPFSLLFTSKLAFSIHSLLLLPLLLLFCARTSGGLRCSHFTLAPGSVSSASLLSLSLLSFTFVRSSDLLPVAISCHHSYSLSISSLAFLLPSDSPHFAKSSAYFHHLLTFLFVRLCLLFDADRLVRCSFESSLSLSSTLSSTLFFSCPRLSVPASSRHL